MSASKLRVNATRTYIFGLSAAALMVLSGWIYVFGFSFDWTALCMSGVLAVVCAVSLRFSLSFGIGSTRFEVVDAVILVALVLGGPLYALPVAAPAMLRREWLRTAFDTATLVFQILVAGYVFSRFSEPLLTVPRFDIQSVYGVVGAGLAFILTDALIGPGLLRVKYKTPIGKLVREVVLLPVPSDIMAIFTALATSYATVAFGPAAALTLFSGTAVSLGLMSFVKQRQERRRDLEAEVLQLREDNARLEQSLSSTSLTFATRIVESLGRKDGYTAAHAAASAVYAGDLAEEFGLDPRKTERLKVAALLQNVGLVETPDEILLAEPGRLNSVGKMHLEGHPSQSERILSGVPGFEEAARWVRWHHERVDGSGYPDRLKGEWIPLEAKILAAAEAYTALILDKPHGPGLPPLDARHALTESIGAALDRQVVRTLLRLLDSNGEGYAVTADARFAFPDSRRETPASGTPHLTVVDGESSKLA